MSPTEDHHTGRLMHELSQVNADIARYILGYLDADADRRGAVPVREQIELADRLETLGKAVRQRAILLEEQQLSVQARQLDRH